MVQQVQVDALLVIEDGQLPRRTVADAADEEALAGELLDVDLLLGPVRELALQRLRVVEVWVEARVAESTAVGVAVAAMVVAVAVAVVAVAVAVAAAVMKAAAEEERGEEEGRWRM